MPELYGILMYAAILGILGMLVLRFVDRTREASRERKEIIERLDRIERRLDEQKTSV